MNKDVFISGIENIYAIFGRKKPEPRHIEIIYKRVKDLPPAFMDFVVNHFENQDNLPKNMGAYLYHELWPLYLERNPELKSHEVARCNNCIPDIPGWRKVYKTDVDENGRTTWESKIIRCSCGSAPNPRNEKIFTDMELLNMGYKFKIEYTAEEEIYFQEWRNKYRNCLLQSEVIKHENKQDDKSFESVSF